MPSNSQLKTNDYYEEKIVAIDQIVNKDDSFKRINFFSADETSDPEKWKSIMLDVGETKKYVMYVLDITEKENITDKAYFLVYGQKRLFAAHMLGLKTVKVRVFSKNIEKALDKNILMRFYSSDYASMIPYEKGAFLNKILSENNMKFEELAPKTGLPYGTLRAVFNAYRVSTSISRHLYNAYKNNEIEMYVVNRSKKYYLYGSDDYSKQLTDFLCRYGEVGFKYIDFYIKNSTEDIFVRNKILKAMSEYEKVKSNEEKGKKRSYDYSWINDACEINSEKAEKFSNIFKNLNLPKGRKKTLYILAAEEIVSLEECCDDFFENISTKMLTTLDYYVGQFEEAKRNYDKLEETLANEYESLNIKQFQPEFKKACLFPYAVTFTKTIGKEFLPYEDSITKYGSKGAFVRFCKYIVFCLNKKLDTESVVKLYDNDFIRGYFNGFCKYAVLHRKSKEKISEFFRSAVNAADSK